MCGYCKNRVIAKDDPICFVKVGRVERELRRCVDCAGPAPPDLPAAIRTKEPGDYSMVAMSSLKPKTRGDLRAHVKEWLPHAADREPGSDDD
jgi:hypothetical protein